jgi:flagellar biosynthesis/type III secretory pathway M-ring protein FliF/YscJ
MSDTLIIVLIVLVALLLVAVGVVLVLLLKSRKGKEVSSEQTGDIKARLEYLDKSTEKTVRRDQSDVAEIDHIRNRCGNSDRSDCDDSGTSLYFFQCNHGNI